MNINIISIIVLLSFTFLPLFAGKRKLISTQCETAPFRKTTGVKSPTIKFSEEMPLINVDTRNLGTWRSIASTKIKGQQKPILDSNVTKKIENPKENNNYLDQKINVPWGQKKGDETFSNIVWTRPPKKDNELGRSLTIINRDTIIKKDQSGNIIYISSNTSFLISK